MRKYIFIFLMLPIGLIVFAQKTNNSQMDNYYPELRKSFNEKNAFNSVAFVEKYWRIAGNAGFNESIYHVEKILLAAGFVKEQKGEADAALTYRIENRKMRKPTWEPISSSLSIVGEKVPLLQSTTNRNMIAINSAGTPIDGETAEIIYVGKGTKTDFEGKVITGKIVFGEAPMGSLFSNAIRKGAIGVLAYSMPGYTQPEKYINSIQFQSIPYQDSVKQKWGIVLSFAAKEKLKSALAQGKILVNVKVNSPLP